MLGNWDVYDRLAGREIRLKPSHALRVMALAWQMTLEMLSSSCSDIGVLVRAGSRGFLAASLADWTAQGRVRILPGPANVGLITRPGSMDVDRALTAEAAAAEVAGSARLPGFSNQGYGDKVQY